MSIDSRDSDSEEFSLGGLFLLVVFLALSFLPGTLLLAALAEWRGIQFDFAQRWTFAVIGSAALFVLFLMLCRSFFGAVAMYVAVSAVAAVTLLIAYFGFKKDYPVRYAMYYFPAFFEQPVDAPPELRPTPAPLTPAQRLNEIVDKQLEPILGPLAGTVAPGTLVKLLELREDLRSAHAQATGSEKQVNALAFNICEALIGAMEVREQHLVSLADSRSKGFSTGLSADAQLAFEQKRDFFEGAIEARWTESSKGYRARIVSLYRQIRSIPAHDAAGMTSQPQGAAQQMAHRY